MADDAYSRYAWCYDTLLEPLNAGLRSIAWRQFQPTAGASILDVGCGTGTQLAFYRRRGYRPAGIDLSPAMLNVARKRLDNSTPFCRGDATRMPYRQHAFDWVMATLVLHEMEVETRAAVLGEMKRTMRASGRMGIVDYHPERLPTAKGWLMRLFIHFAEIAAGTRHYANFRQFIARGGIPVLARDLGLVIEHQKRVSGGNIGIYLLRQEP